MTAPDTEPAATLTTGERNDRAVELGPDRGPELPADPEPQRASRWRWDKGLGFPLVVYCTSRALVWLSAYFVGWFRVYPESTHVSAIPVLGSWDGIWYRAIVEHGYSSTLRIADGAVQQSEHAFFPLYPLFGRALNVVSPLGTIQNLLLLSFVFGAAATALVWMTARDLFDAEIADASCAIFCFLPGSFALSFAYSEGLLITLALGSLWALRRQRWVLAGVLAALAGATRPSGLVLLVCAAWAAVVAIRERRQWSALVAPALAPLGFLAYQVFLAVRTGSVDAWWRVEHEGWGTRFDAGRGVLLDTVHVLTGSDRSISTVIVVVSAVSAAAGFVVLLRSKLPVIHTIYAAGIVGLPLATANLSARPRFVFTAVPLAIAAARLPARLRWAIVAVGGASMVALVLWYGWPSPGARAVVPP